VAQSPPEPVVEALRIQAAAVVAQQAALTEHELRLIDREAALARQEEQLGSRLEDERQQLLDLQDQITEARMKLREKRAAHAALAEQQQRELAAAREEAAELQRTARGERQRLKDLRRRLLQRGRKHGEVRRAEFKALRLDAERLAAERAAFLNQVKEVNGESELDKRRLKEAWDRLHRERAAWQDQRAIDDRAAAERIGDLARREKAIIAAEKRMVAERAQLDQDRIERMSELEQLETRIGNARMRLLDEHAVQIRPETRDPRHENDELVSRVSGLVSDSLSEPEVLLDQQRQVLARVADELADQRLHLVEQVERMLRTQHEWQTERTATLNEIETIGVKLHARETDLDRRAREVQTARASVQSEFESLGHLRLRLDAERSRAESHDADRRAEVLGRWQELDVRERTLQAREDGWRGLLRTWGQRRRHEVVRLRNEQIACRQERTEWVAARTVWLRLIAKLREERRALTVRSLAVERLRVETVAGAGGQIAAKRLERLERQWTTHCEHAARELERMQATLTAEAARVDEASAAARRAVLAAEARAVTLDKRAAEVEREEQCVVAERTQTAGELDAARERQWAAERRAAALRDEIERLARLLIDAGPGKEELPASQAA
jgi:hypothetical protein